MTDALVEAGGKAVFDAIDPNTGDTIGTTIHMSVEMAYGDGEIEQQLVAVHKTCRAAFTAALQAIEAAGYRVAPSWQGMDSAGAKSSDLTPV